MSFLAKNLLKRCLTFLQNDKIPDEHRENVVNHVVYVHQTVGVFSKTFLQKLRRVNYTTPKNYLDFINTYNKLLEEKDKFVLEQVKEFMLSYYFKESGISSGLMGHSACMQT